jgi:rRNA-processing protein EBP2
MLDSGDGADLAELDKFDVAIDDALSSKDRSGPGPKKKAKMSRSSRDNKFGFGSGGGGKRGKQNTRESTDDFAQHRGGKGSFTSGGGAQGGRGFGPGGKAAKGSKGGGGRHGSKRLGKSRRMSAKSKK